MALSKIDELLERSRAVLDRVSPADLEAEMAAGAFVVDTRPVAQRDRDGELPGSVVIDRNVLEWRVTPTSDVCLPGIDENTRLIVVCNEGYSSSLAAATLRELGLSRATDLDGGFQALLVHWAEAGERNTE